AIARFAGPDTEEGLVVVVFVEARRRRLALDLAAVATVHHAPAPQRQPPARSELGEHAEARAHVLGALGVMRRGGEHGVRPMLRPVFARRMEGLERQAEVARIVADLVQRREAHVAVERGVLYALRHYRR